MLAKRLRDDQWKKIKDSLPGKVGDLGHTAADNRLFIDAVIWIGRNGGCRRDLPPSYGIWNSTYRRFRRWACASCYAANKKQKRGALVQ